jgi:hypothetical protein
MASVCGLLEVKCGHVAAIERIGTVIKRTGYLINVR